MVDLKEVRREIDRIDEELVQLFIQRMEASRQVAHAKRERGDAVTDPVREREILARVSTAAGPENENAARLFFSTLFALSKARQRNLLGGEVPLGRPIRLHLAIVGMGLIGGSFYKASCAAGHTVTTLHHGDTTGWEDADLILVCLPPDAIVPWITAHAATFKKGAVVIDIAGIKRDVMREMSQVPRDGWTFIGGHPMAGREVSGYENSLADLFVGASMILVPFPGEEEKVTEDLRGYFASVGFGRVMVTTPERHDEMIAFTSQLCHVIATAYSRDRRIPDTPGFSAGSFADMTRIATQDPAIWSVLFSTNRDVLLEVLNDFITRISEFRDALAVNDLATLSRIIAEGAIAKRATQGK